eukprot:993465-Prymnesium_polylepis.1
MYVAAARRAGRRWQRPVCARALRACAARGQGERLLRGWHSAHGDIAHGLQSGAGCARCGP